MKQLAPFILYLLRTWLNSFYQEHTNTPKIIPAFGDCHVSAELKEIIVMFNQEMHSGMSVPDSRDMPQITAKPINK